MEEGKGTVDTDVSACFPDLLLCREPGLGGPSRGRDAIGSQRLVREESGLVLSDTGREVEF